MEAMGILGFIFGLIAFVRLEKLTKTLKEKGILEQEYKKQSWLKQICRTTEAQVSLTSYSLRRCLFT